MPQQRPPRYSHFWPACTARYRREERMTMNRRTFTRLGALGAAFASVPIVSGCTAQKRSGLDVLIIGGGLSGLAAGWELKKGGFERFAVLEARDRVGGGTLNQKVNRAPVEAGATRSEEHTSELQSLMR